MSVDFSIKILPEYYLLYSYQTEFIRQELKQISLAITIRFWTIDDAPTSPISNNKSAFPVIPTRWLYIFLKQKVDMFFGQQESANKEEIETENYVNQQHMESAYHQGENNSMLKMK